MAVPDLSLAEWIVLTLVDEEPRHGFAVAALTAEDADLGEIWTVAKPIVYRALNRLTELDLVQVTGTEYGGRGPQRSVQRTTRSGRSAVRTWLRRPVKHLRDTRSEFLIKLALLDRRDIDARPLVMAQRKAFTPMAQALQQRTDSTEGFARVLAAWRSENASAVLNFLDEI